MQKWECYRCGHVVEAENTPDECPNCHYSVSLWISHLEEKQAPLKEFVRPLLRVDGNASALDVARLMRDRDTENVLVTIEGKPKGIVTEKDILVKIAAEDLNASKVLLREIMSPELITAPTDTPVTEAIKMMAAHHIRRIVVTEQGEVVGIVSHRSILGGSFRATAPD